MFAVRERIFQIFAVAIKMELLAFKIGFTRKTFWVYAYDRIR